MHEPEPLLAILLHRLPPALQGWVDVSVLHAFIAIALLAALARLSTLRLQDPPGATRLQMLMEWVYEVLENYFTRIIGPKGPQFTPLLGTFFLYILTMNLMGVIPGLLSPTSRLAVTAALGCVAFLAVQYFGFKEKGIRYLMHFVGEPLWLAPLNIPIHVIGELARPLSLSIRLFGNIFGEDTAVIVFLMLSTMLASLIYVPIPFQLPMVIFAIFGGFVQAVVFTSLTAAYIAGAISEEH
ncbi:MAG: F0F1 ATP synthase subunit A [Armatimonadetes bacterium]|nr:F0F1 ATP synthase subunit A [Armatimonadota bacterium]